MNIKIAAAADQGPRENYEDAWSAIEILPQGIELLSMLIALMLDGLGGHDGGEVASAEARRIINASLAASLLLDPEEGNAILAPNFVLAAMSQACVLANLSSG